MRFLSGSRSEVEITSVPKESSAVNPVSPLPAAGKLTTLRYLAYLRGVALITTSLIVLLFAGISATPAHAETSSVKYQTTSPNPDGRRYELATPPNKNGALLGSLIVRHPPAEIAASGTRVIAPSDQCFSEPEGCTAYRLTEGEPYEFERTATGWVTHALAPSAASYEASSPWTIDADAGTALFSAPSSSDGPDDFLARDPAGAFANVGPFGEQRPGPGNDQANASQIAGAGVFSTADLSHVVFATEKSLWTFDESEYESVYEYAGSGGTTPLMVGVEGAEGSHTLISTCGEHVAGFHTTSAVEALSEDGRTVYFTAEGRDYCLNGTKLPVVTGLYERVDGESAGAHTVLVSGPTPSTCSSAECLVNTKPGSEAEEKLHFRAAEFEGASPDGSRVFFTSTQQLTNGASEGGSETDTAYAPHCHNIAEVGGCNLYESVCSEPCGVPGEEMFAANREVVDLSEGAGVEGPRVQGVMAIAEDGKHVYFVAKGVLTGGQENANHEKAEPGEENLYLYSGEDAADGHVTFVARLSGTDTQEEQWNDGENLIANVSPDGRFLVFTDDRALTADDTRSGASGEGAAQVYEYDALSGSLTRLSVGEEGFDGDGNEGTGNAHIVPAWRGGATDGSVPVRVDPTMSADGRLVFFESPIALTAGALNDYPIGEGKLAENVYEYFHGQVSLISDGKDTTAAGYVSEALSQAPTELLGVSTTGADVVFSTFDSLVAEDGDTQRDYYDAHICSEASPCIEKTGEVAPCEGEACQGAPSTPPLFAAPTSATLTGSSGNLSAPPAATPPPKKAVKKATKCRKGFVRKHNKCVKNRKKPKRK